MKIDVLMVETSQYGVLHHFTTKIHEALVRAGVESTLHQGQDIFVGPLRTKPDLTLAFNGMPRNSSLQPVCDDTKIPHLALLVDPPYRFFYLLNSPYTLVACDDFYSNKFLDEIGYRKHLFIPHAVEPDLKPLGTDERIYDLVLLASFSDPKERRKKWNKIFPPFLIKILDEIVEITLSNSDIPFIAAFNAIISSQSKNIKKLSNVPFYIVLEEIEMYLKEKERLKLVQAFEETPLHIFGSKPSPEKWKKLIGNKPLIFHHGPIHYHQALEVMRKTKILLNPSIKNKGGAHERVFAGSALGALIVTNPSRYLSETFKHKESIYFYDPQNLSSLESDLKILIEDNSTRSSIAEQGKIITMKLHTWDNRVQKILNELPDLISKFIPR